ncbi:hypothetical protein LIA77_02565 [Sarocladium implicatum]|nr:hypothetical protein LIA77_02565 [Sarocladium implicatum]
MNTPSWHKSHLQKTNNTQISQFTTCWMSQRASPASSFTLPHARSSKAETPTTALHQGLYPPRSRHQKSFSCSMCKIVKTFHRCKGCGLGRGQTNEPDLGKCRRYRKLKLRAKEACPDFPTDTIIEDQRDYRCQDCQRKKDAKGGCNFL